MIIKNYRPMDKGALIAFFDVTITKWGGFTIKGCSLMRSNSNQFVNMPSNAVDGEDGKKKYFAHCGFFDNKETQEAFKGKILAAVHEFCKQQSLAKPDEKKDAFDDIPF